MSILLRDLRFNYSSTEAEPLLDIPEWSVASGEQVFLHGPSGCGKTTLLNLLGGLLSGYQGQLQVLGTELNTLRSHQRDRFRARHLGYVFQQFNLIPYLNAVDNIRLADHFSGRSTAASLASRMDQLLDQLNLTQTQRHQPASQLSIGQQQRVAIARALINEPDILIVDEPTSSLDHSNRDAFMQLLLEGVNARNTTLIFVSHDPALAQHFSRQDAMTQLNRRAR